MNSVTIIILTIALFFAVPVIAQNRSDTTGLSVKIKGAEETKRTGATLTILGGAALVAGLVIVNSDLDAGAGIGTAGLVATAIGLPIWIVGSVNHKKYTKRAQALTVRLQGYNYQRGLALNYRF